MGSLDSAGAYFAVVGPDGFTNTITKMDVQPGGGWDLVMHGPDGMDYKNKSVFKEVVKHKKIVYEHVSSPKFTASVEKLDLYLTNSQTEK